MHAGMCQMFQMLFWMVSSLSTTINTIIKVIWENHVFSSIWLKKESFIASFVGKVLLFYFFLSVVGRKKKRLSTVKKWVSSQVTSIFSFKASERWKTLCPYFLGMLRNHNEDDCKESVRSEKQMCFLGSVASIWFCPFLVIAW